MKKLFPFLITALVLAGFESSEAKKIKNSFRVDKQPKPKVGEVMIEGMEVNLTDSLNMVPFLSEPELEELRKVTFAGYDKEPNSNKESFILVNPSEKVISGYKVRIDYLDMQGRMLHSRTIKEACSVPPGESRRFDISTWDLQHTYYYYLGNEPKRVATPFQVTFYPEILWIEE